jgi:hypothetical protein
MGARVSARERGIELVHAEIDGELHGMEKAELGRLLLADPSLRVMRQELRGTCAAIDAVPLEEPPPGLHQSVMESLPASQPECADRDVHPVRRRLSGPTLRYAAAFAGGLLVSALAFQFGVRPELLDPRELSGTIAAVTADPSRLELHLDEVSGTVRLEGPAAAPVVVAELAASRPVQVIARLGGEQLRLEGFVAAQQGGRQGLRAAFATRPGRHSVRVEVTIVDSASGDVLQATTLRPTVRNENN